MKIERPANRANAKINLLIYSLTGGGKTRFCGSAQKCEHTSPTLLIDIGGGTNTLAGLAIDIVRPRNLTEFQEIYDFLREDNNKYKSVCLDGITGLQQELSMPEVQEIRASGEKDDYSDLARAEPPDRRHWLKSHEHIRRILRAFRDLCILPDRKRRLHVIMTALEKKDEMRSIVCPHLPGVLGLEVGAYFDLLGRLSVQIKLVKEEPVAGRVLLLQEEEDEEGMRQLAKSRWSGLSGSIWNPTVKKLMSKWTEGGESETNKTS